DNPIKQVMQEPLTTFSLDVDTGSYANARRFVSQGRMPHPDAVRVEEFINYFPPASAETASRLGNAPFAVSYEMAPSPWSAGKVLLRVNVQAVDVDMKELPPANLVFLVDVSGSMSGSDRLGLLQASLKILVDQLRPQDKVSLVVYAGATRVVLEPTSGSEKAKIRAAIDQLQAGGSTAGAAGLKLAYQMAEQGFIQGSVNRILLATDGDFNVGTRDTEELKAMVTRGREKGITLSTLGFGDSNYNEAMMVQVADVGNGNYSYIDTLSEAQKVLQEEMCATLVTVAQDVKAQIEFNPNQVLEYRQIGYEKRQLRNEDFNNDKVDAGDIGAGKRVTVLYELTLAGGKPSVDALRYQGEKPVETSFNQHSQEIAFLKLRWKEPGEQESQLVSLPLERSHLRGSFNQASVETRFLAAVAAYGQKLRNNPQLVATSWEQIGSWGKNALGIDPNGYRAEFVKLVGQVQSLSKDQ
ncbi:MAG: vWA domain-containing protein, partial [Saezia sp.]